MSGRCWRTSATASPCSIATSSTARKARRYDLGGPATSWQITRRYVGEQVAMLISGFINAKSATELFTFRLVLAIEAANPSAIVLEATCRELILAKPIVPAVSEVIEELGRQGEWWFFALDSIRFLAETMAQANAPRIPPGGAR
jgi:hypothetical protein